ncbi:MAG: MFS transporter [Pseudomonadota bacterium]
MAPNTSEDGNTRLRPGSVVAAVSGNALEWYDFCVYGFLAPVIATLFFPSDNEVTALLSAFAVFAVGYAARPVGSIIFGHIGDRVGRKPALLLSIAIMCVSSVALGLLPTYEQIGIAAPVLLTLIRIAQGIAVAGEYGASGILIIEHARKERRALMGSWVVFAMMGGSMLGSLVPAVMSDLLTTEQIAAWGWRVPFFLGAVVAVAGLVLRRTLADNAGLPFAQDDLPLTPPIVEILREERGTLLRIVLLLMPIGILYFLIFTYAASYLAEQSHFTSAQALNITTLNLGLMTLAIPIFGALGDRFGLRTAYLTIALATFITAVPAWWLMHRPDLGVVFLGQMVLALVNGAASALTVAALAGMCQPHLRCTTIALGYNVAMAIFGGTTPLIATYIANRTGGDFAPIYYLIFATLLSLPVLWRLPVRQTPSEA